MKRLLALALFAPAFALAQESDEISYNYFGVDYMGSNWDFGVADVDASGLGGEFSIDIRDQFFIFADYHTWEFDDFGDAGSVSKTFGVGKDFDLGQNWSVFGSLGFTMLDLDVGLGNVEDEGGMIEAGVRWHVADGFELRFGAEYADVGDTGIGEASVNIGGDLHLTDVIALTVELSENEEEITTWKVGVRFYPTKDSSALRQRR